MAISSAGLGSGLNVADIVSQLVSIERQPINKLKTEASSIQSKISSFGKAQSLVSTLRDSAAALGRSTLWSQTTATSADTTAVSATTSGAVAAGDYAVSVSKLAQAHTLYSDVVTDPGAGTMTITSGTKSVNLSFSDPATTLDQVRDAINGSGVGITAAVVKDAGGNARLSLTAKSTGSSNQITVATTGTGYASFTSAALHEAQAAQDAALTINGVPVTSSTNEVNGAVSGLSLKLTKETSSPVKVTVADDTATQKKALEDFVSAYNALNTYLADQTKYDAGTKTAGTLQGDSSAVGLRNQVRSAVLGSGGISSAFTTLNSIGITLQKDGSLKLDSTKAAEALKQPAELSKLFANVDTLEPLNNGLGVSLRQSLDQITGTDGLLSTRTAGLKTRLKQNETNQSTLEDRVARTQARLEKYYQALDTKMNSLNSLSNYVSQQVKAWSNASSSDK